MKYFSNAWASGDLSEAENARVLADYSRDLAATFDENSSVRRFVSAVGLNDAYVDKVSFDPGAGKLDLLLLTGSLQVGYWHTQLSYSGVIELIGEPVLKAALATRPTEIWYDEFYREGDDICHAFLLTPRGQAIESFGEYAVRFKRFDYSQMPAKDRELMSSDDRSDWAV